MGVDCKKCLYFKITWEKERPYACGAFGFKSGIIPSKEVYMAAGKECLKFSPKNIRKNK
ncbi:MAG: hypothetical protein WC061_07635 [Melioribacteraceae bacterium]